MGNSKEHYKRIIGDPSFMELETFSSIGLGLKGHQATLISIIGTATIDRGTAITFEIPRRIGKCPKYNRPVRTTKYDPKPANVPITIALNGDCCVEDLFRWVSDTFPLLTFRISYLVTENLITKDICTWYRKKRTEGAGAMCLRLEDVNGLNESALTYVIGMEAAGDMLFDACMCTKTTYTRSVTKSDC